MTKYSEYKEHSKALLRIAGVLNSKHVVCDTVENVAFLPKDARLHFKRIGPGTFILTVIQSNSMKGYSEPKTLGEIFAAEKWTSK